MIIILDGPEAAGKSTLAEYLSKVTGYPIKHRSRPKSEEEKQQMMQSYRDDIASGDNIIWDRCWYSEMTYGPIMRDQSYINTAQMLELEKKLVEKGGLVIYCTDTIDNLWDRCRTRGEDYIATRETLDEIRQYYDYLMYEIPHIVPIVRYTINEKNMLLL